MVLNSIKKRSFIKLPGSRDRSYTALTLIQSTR